MDKANCEWHEYKPHTRKRIKIKTGYIYVWCPEHPNANIGKKNHKGYIQEHRLVMSNYLCRPLDEFEHVHHINGDKTDNRIENLELMSNSEHRKIHAAQLTKDERVAKAKYLIIYAASRKIPRVEIECACGCGQTFMTPDSRGRYHKFIHGHNAKGKHWRWKKNEQN